MKVWKHRVLCFSATKNRRKSELLRSFCMSGEEGGKSKKTRPTWPWWERKADWWFEVRKEERFANVLTHFSWAASASVYLILMNPTSQQINPGSALIHRRRSHVVPVREGLDSDKPRSHSLTSITEYEKKEKKLELSGTNTIKGGTTCLYWTRGRSQQKGEGGEGEGSTEGRAEREMEA